MPTFARASSTRGRDSTTQQPDNLKSSGLQNRNNIFKRIFNFYYQGFKSMTWGKQVWLIIIIKLFIMFAVLKLFFFPDFLKTNFKTDEERGNYVIEQLTDVDEE